MVRSLAAALLLLGLPLLVADEAEPRIERRTISSGGSERQYYFFAPRVRAAKARSLFRRWRRRWCCITAAAATDRKWSAPGCRWPGRSAFC